MKFYENPSSRAEVFYAERTDWRMDMTKLKVTFFNLAKASKILIKLPYVYVP